jgi:hypothetical protein
MGMGEHKRIGGCPMEFSRWGFSDLMENMSFWGSGRPLGALEPSKKVGGEATARLTRGLRCSFGGNGSGMYGEEQSGEPITNPHRHFLGLHRGPQVCSGSALGTSVHAVCDPVSRVLSMFCIES